MIKKKHIELFRTIFVTGIAFGVNYLINLVLTPFITKNVSTEAYGFVSLAKNFAQYASIITIALNSFATRYIALDYHTDNKKGANVYFSSVFYGDLIVASIIVACAIIFAVNIDFFLTVPVEIVEDVKLLFVFVFVNFWITTVFTVFASAAIIKNKLDISGLFRGLSYVAEALGLYAMYKLFKPQVFYVGVGLIIGALVIALSNIWLCRKYTSDLKINRKNFSFKAIKTLVLKGIWTSINSLGNILNSGLDLIVCNLLLSPLAMGQLAIAKTMDAIFHGFYTIVAQAFQPMFLKSYANSKERLIGELKFS
ncbi:MAG: oligosaccharide flippase family protein, partial [Lachnospirales bacterium]